LATSSSVGRTSSGSTHSTIDRRRIKLFFQRFAGTDAHGGIAQLDFVVRIGADTPIQGKTPANGLVQFLLGPGETAVVEVLGSSYEVTLAGPLANGSQLRGVQQRLSMLGYSAGPLESGTPPVLAVTGQNQDVATERAIINFQSDHNPLVIDAVAGPRTQNSLNGVVRGAGGE
jgi:hypothetical protein